MSEPTAGLAEDHAELYDPVVARRYFAQFDRIIGHLARMAAEHGAGRGLARAELRVLMGRIEALVKSFRALRLKYLMTGRAGPVFTGRLVFDRHESGFPVFAELLTMANDAAQAERQLAALPAAEAIKEAMLAEILGERRVPVALQFALSQRLYCEALRAGGLFWARNDPEALWQADLPEGRRRYLLHWAVYDSQVNLPVVYLMDLEDSGRTALPLDSHRWPQARAHLMAQSLAGLKLVTIADGFDRDFADLHPKRLRRLHLGPMYAHAFTLQSGPIREVLAEAHAPDGEDWALVWTLEDLESERSEMQRQGLFGRVERQIFALDPFGGRGAETGATRTERAVLMPERVFQVLAQRQPAGFGQVTKFVVGPGGRILRLTQGRGTRDDTGTGAG